MAFQLKLIFSAVERSKAHQQIVQCIVVDDHLHQPVLRQGQYESKAFSAGDVLPSYTVPTIPASAADEQLPVPRVLPASEGADDVVQLRESTSAEANSGCGGDDDGEEHDDAGDRDADAVGDAGSAAHFHPGRPSSCPGARRDEGGYEYNDKVGSERLRGAASDRKASAFSAYRRSRARTA